ncbi:MAG: hypothetical protein ACFE0Q_21440 [Anaerolineae bacterium]
MSILNPGTGLVQFHLSIIELYNEDNLTDDMLLNLFERLSNSYIVGKVAFLLVDDTGQLIRYIDVESPRNPNPGFDYASDALCKQYIIESRQLLRDLINVDDDKKEQFWFVELRSTPSKEIVVLARPIVTLNKFVFVITRKGHDSLIY